MNLADFDISLNFNDGEKYRFDLKLDDTFFALKENSLLNSGLLKADMEFERREDALDLRVSIQGQVFSECDRCLEEIALPVSTTFTHYLKFTSDEDLLGDETHIAADSASYSVYDLLYENICINVPQRHLCENSTKAVECEIESFNQKTKANDPRWDQLKKLID